MKNAKRWMKKGPGDRREDGLARDHHAWAITSQLTWAARARYDRTLAQEAEESFEGLAAFALERPQPARPRHSRSLDQ